MLHPTFAVPALDLTGRKLELHVEYHIRVRERIGVVEWRGVESRALIVIKIFYNVAHKAPSKNYQTIP